MTEKDVRALFAKALGRSAEDELIPAIAEEVCTETDRWRRDLVIRWSPTTTSCIELKLLARFTPQQLKAIRDQKAHLVVALTREGVPPDVPCITWREIACAVKDETIAELIRQVAAFTSEESIDLETVREEFANFVTGDIKRGWSTMYRFLSTVHSHLYNTENCGYQANAAWHMSRREKNLWYGYNFHASGRPFWLGFERLDAAPFFSLWTYSTKSRAFQHNGAVFSVEALVARILDEIDAGPVAVRGE